MHGPLNTQSKFKLIRTKNSKLKIDDQIFEIETFVEAPAEKAYLEDDLRETFVIKKAHEIFGFRIDQSDERILDENEIKLLGNLDSRIEEDIYLETKKEIQRNQKDLYLNLAHCRKVNGYEKVLEIAKTERESIYFRPEQGTLLPRPKFFLKYNYKQKKIEGFVQTNPEIDTTLTLGSIIIGSNLRDMQNMPILDNLYFSAHNFGKACLAYYKNLVFKNSHIGEEKNLWLDTDANLFNESDDDRVSAKINDVNRYSPQPIIILPEDLFSHKIYSTHEVWANHLDQQNFIIKNNLAMQLLKNLDVIYNEGDN